MGDSGEIDAGALFLELVLSDDFKSLNVEPTPKNMTRILVGVFLNREATEEDYAAHAERMGAAERADRTPVQVVAMEFYGTDEFNEHFAAAQAAAGWEPAGGWDWADFGADWD